MSKQAYRKARRLIRDNGYYAVRWLRMGEASVMLRLRYQKDDVIACGLLDSHMKIEARGM